MMQIITLTGLKINQKWIFIRARNNQVFVKESTKNLNILNEMPTVKKVFLKFNTPLPSSAAVERIFSIGGALFCQKKEVG